MLCTRHGARQALAQAFDASSVGEFHVMVRELHSISRMLPCFVTGRSYQRGARVVRVEYKVQEGRSRTRPIND